MVKSKVNTCENNEKQSNIVKDEKVTDAQVVESEKNVSNDESVTIETSIDDHPRMKELREKVLEYIKANEGAIHPEDVELLKTNNLWINRFLNFSENTFEKAYEHLIETFKHRKEFGIKSIDKTIFPVECWLASTAFIYLPDKEGRPTLYVRVKHHLKAEGKFNDLFKQFLVVLIDEIDKLANKEQGYNYFLDLCDMGWKNLDLDMLQFLLETSRYKYPNGTKYCFISGLPWFLRIIIKNIVLALPSDTSKKVRFVNVPNHKELPLDQVTSNFVKMTDLNNTSVQTIDNEEKKRTKQEIEEYYDLNNLPSYLGGKATLNHRIMPRSAISSIYKVGTMIYGYSEPETQRMAKPFKNVINDAQQSYKTFKEMNFNFEFELSELSNALIQHLKL